MKKIQNGIILEKQFKGQKPILHFLFNIDYVWLYIMMAFMVFLTLIGLEGIIIHVIWT